MQAKWVPYRKSRRTDYDNKADVRSEASRYLKAHVFIERMRKHIDVVTMQEYKDMREQALGGDIQGAEEKLKNILGGRG